MSQRIIGFLGAGGIAKSHAFALSSLKYYYADAPDIIQEAVHSIREESRNTFARNFDFRTAVDLSSFLENRNINTIYILGPNNIHFTHLEAVMKMPEVDRIYLEKPVCSNLQEEEQMTHFVEMYAEKKIQIGFQMTQMAAIQKALQFWESQDFGKTIHFNFTLKHGDYLKKAYREKRLTRLTLAPDGGAMADLGSHAVSMAVAFVGEDLTILNAIQGGAFPDVPAGSDLYSEISLYQKSTGAVGTISGSRVSSGTGDYFAFEIFAEKGAIKFTSQQPDCFEYYLEESGNWVKIFAGSNFQPATSFPSEHVPGGWLRSLIHAHYVFLSDKPNTQFIPDLKHGPAVQRIVRETAEQLTYFRNKIDKLV